MTCLSTLGRFVAYVHVRSQLWANFGCELENAAFRTHCERSHKGQGRSFDQAVDGRFLESVARTHLDKTKVDPKVRPTMEMKVPASSVDTFEDGATPWIHSITDVQQVLASKCKPALLPAIADGDDGAGVEMFLADANADAALPLPAAEPEARWRYEV